jgi:hypothetical protein
MSFIPNTTPTPNWLYNGEMKKMSDTELRVVLCITRKTLGWIENPKTGMRKQEDWISHTELIKMSGKSSPSISKAINKCVEHGWIETRDKSGNLLLTSKERRRRRVYYRLGNIFTDKLKSTKVSKVDENLPNLTTKSTLVDDTNLPNLLRNTKETLTKETNTKMEQSSPPLKENSFREISNLYSELFASSYPDKTPIVQWDICQKLARPYIEKLGVEKMKELLRIYFNSDDKFYLKVGHSLTTFLSANIIHGLLNGWEEEIKYAKNNKVQTW